MASSNDRQRKLERARMERRLVNQAKRARKRRQLQASIAGAVALVLLVFGVFWLTGAFKSEPKPPATTATGACAWTPRTPSDSVKDVGQPPATGEVRSGTRTMTIKTNQGEIAAELDLTKAPCAAQSFTYLAGQKFFDSSPCHRLTTAGLYVLQCGDPSGTGTGGPAYTFPDEFLPTSAATPSAGATPTDLYPKGTIAMANSGPNTNSSQFFIVYKDGSGLAGNYTIIGRITKGLDVVEKVASAGAVDETGKVTQDGKPKTSVTIETLTMGEAQTGAPSTPTPAPAATPTPSAAPSAKPSTSASAAS